MRRYVRALLFLSLVSLAVCAPLEMRVTEPFDNASTKADHQTLANYYEREAKELTRKAEASRHQARVYGVFPYGAPKSTVTFAQHYNAVTERLEAEAKDSLGLAAEHRKEAALTLK